MKKLWSWIFFWGPVALVWAGSPGLPQKVHPPYFLHAKDKIPRGGLACPDVDLQGADNQPLDLEINITPPDPTVMDIFCAPALFEKIQHQKPSETALQRFYWHMVDEIEYCHFKDMEGNHWYGWQDSDGKFSWILWRGHRYWWHDAFAGHWLYYFQGVWWRADGQKKNSIQANMDGEYYTCDAQGNVLGDMGQDGSGGIVSAPGRYQGDSHGGHGGRGHGGHGDRSDGGHEGHNGAQPSQGYPQGASAPPSQNTNPSGSPSGN